MRPLVSPPPTSDVGTARAAWTVIEGEKEEEQRKTSGRLSSGFSFRVAAGRPSCRHSRFSIQSVFKSRELRLPNPTAPTVPSHFTKQPSVLKMTPTRTPTRTSTTANQLQVPNKIVNGVSCPELKQRKIPSVFIELNL